MFRFLISHKEPIASQVLISQGANIDAQSSTGWTPLMKASFKNRFPVVEALIRSGMLSYL